MNFARYILEIPSEASRKSKAMTIWLAKLTMSAGDKFADSNVEKNSSQNIHDENWNEQKSATVVH